MGFELKDGDLVINVWNLKAELCRYIEERGFGKFVLVEPQPDEEELLEAIEKQGGAINISGWYQVPEWLSRRYRSER